MQISTSFGWFFLSFKPKHTEKYIIIIIITNNKLKLNAFEFFLHGAEYTIRLQLRATPLLWKRSKELRTNEEKCIYNVICKQRTYVLDGPKKRQLISNKSCMFQGSDWNVDSNF